jgi:hypothetical protein
LISFFWSGNGTHGLLDTLKETPFNTTFFTAVVMLGLIKKATSRSRRKMLEGRMIHADNAHSHNSRLSQECISASKAERLPHPVYSLDIAPSDFFFGHLKETVCDDNCASQPYLLKTIAEFFSQIDKAMLVFVFKSWRQLLQ